MNRKIKVGDLIYASSENREHGSMAIVLNVTNGIATLIYPDGFTNHEYCSFLLKPYTREERERIANGIAVY